MFWVQSIAKDIVKYLTDQFWFLRSEFQSKKLIIQNLIEMINCSLSNSCQSITRTGEDDPLTSANPTNSVLKNLQTDDIANISSSFTNVVN